MNFEILNFTKPNFREHVVYAYAALVAQWSRQPTSSQSEILWSHMNEPGLASPLLISSNLIRAQLS